MREPQQGWGKGHQKSVRAHRRGRQAAVVSEGARGAGEAASGRQLPQTARPGQN